MCVCGLCTQDQCLTQKVEHKIFNKGLVRLTMPRTLQNERSQCTGAYEISLQ